MSRNCIMYLVLILETKPMSDLSGKPMSNPEATPFNLDQISHQIRDLGVGKVNGM
jgi:hypothetical protein